VESTAHGIKSKQSQARTRLPVSPRKSNTKSVVSIIDYPDKNKN